MMTLLRFPALVAICLSVLSTQDIFAATEAADLVSPARSDMLASPLTFRSVQTSSETENPSLSFNSDGTPCWGKIGIDTWIGNRVKMYDLPVSFGFSPALQAQLDIPFASATTGSYYAGSTTETGLGDIILSIKFRAEVEKLFESYYIFSAKFPSGVPESGLSTGSRDFSFTQKTIVMFDTYRTTFMAGITIPPPVSITLREKSVEYGPTISYMVATESPLSSTGFRYGIKVAGLHAFNSRINSELQKNAVTTLDIIPEVTWRIYDSVSLKAGVIIPIMTLYDLPGAVNRRDPIINLSVSKTF
jgi:hypothetical protein